MAARGLILVSICFSTLKMTSHKARKISGTQHSVAGGYQYYSHDVDHLSEGFMKKDSLGISGMSIYS